jgi:hypothetical protein
MAFRLALNRPEQNPRLKLKPGLDAGMSQRFTAATLWKEIGNGRIRVQGTSPSQSRQINEPSSRNPTKR